MPPGITQVQRSPSTITGYPSVLDEQTGESEIEEVRVGMKDPAGLGECCPGVLCGGESVGTVVGGEREDLRSPGRGLVLLGVSLAGWNTLRRSAGLGGGLANVDVATVLFVLPPRPSPPSAPPALL